MRARLPAVGDGAFGAVATPRRTIWQDRRMIDIGRVGLWISLLDQYPTSRVREVVAELESLGWPCLWRPEATGPRRARLGGDDARCDHDVADRHRHRPDPGPPPAHRARRPDDAARGVRRPLPARPRRQPRADDRGRPQARVRRRPTRTWRPTWRRWPRRRSPPSPAPDEPTTVIAALGPKMLRLAAERRRRRPPVLLAGRAHRRRARDPRPRQAAGARADGRDRRRPRPRPSSSPSST